jgi:hypothetical protein
VAPRRWAAAGNGGRGWWCLEARGSRGVQLCGEGCYGKPRRALYRRGKAVRGGISPQRPAAEGPRRGRFRKNPYVAGEVPSGIRSVVLWDMTRRAGELGNGGDGGGVERSAPARVEVTGRAGE